LNLKQLESFVRVAEQGSLARAAVATDQAESLISRHVAALESEWGDRLFERTGRGMALSDFGRRMLPEVRAALEQVGRLAAVARESAGIPTGTVNIGVLPSIARQLLPLLFADLRVSAPAVTLHATEGFSGDLDAQLASGRLDIALINRYGASVARGEEVLGTADTWLIGKAGSPLLAEGTVAFKALAGVPLVLPSVPNGLRATLDQLSRKHGVQLRIVMEVDSSGSMKDVALSGHAYTLLPLMALKEELERKTLGAARVVKPAIRRTIALALTTQRPLSRAARHVASRIRVLAPKLVG
jgi:LysR family transcriptional regulator, nitrogen assimilation regulatory protein